MEPLEPPHLRVEVIDLTQAIDDLITVALTHRPELASRQAGRRAGTLATGVFAGGPGSRIGDPGMRFDLESSARPGR